MSFSCRVLFKNLAYPQLVNNQQTNKYPNYDLILKIAFQTTQITIGTILLQPQMEKV
jgi:hypothetical protein